MIPPLVALTAAGTALSVAGEVWQRTWARALGKVTASGAFVTLGAALHLQDTRHGRWALAGLVLGAVGDLLLLADAKRPFLAGIIAFLLGHLAYVGALWPLGVALKPAAAAFAVMVVVGGLVLRWTREGAGRLWAAVGLYVAVIAVMVAAAVGVAAHDPTRWRRVLGIAAVVFAASDILVARQRFVVRSPMNRVIGLPLYYAAQVAIAVAMARV